MALNPQGILAAVTIAMYIPFLFISFKALAKYGVAQGRAWLVLTIFCTIRILGGALLVAAEEVTPVNTSLYIGGYALESIGLSPLLLCTLGLLRIIFQTPGVGDLAHPMLFRLLHILGMVAVALTIFGIADSGSSSAEAMRRAGVLLFVLLYVIIVGISLLLWSRVHTVMKYRKELLKAISIALPFLAVRTLYSVLSTFSSSTFSISATSTPNDSALAKFNIVTGEWQIFLVMDMLMEYGVVIIFGVASLMLPLDLDYKYSDSNDSDEYYLNAPQYPSSAPRYPSNAPQHPSSTPQYWS